MIFLFSFFFQLVVSQYCPSLGSNCYSCILRNAPGAVGSAQFIIDSMSNSANRDDCTTQQNAIQHWCTEFANRNTDDGCYGSAFRGGCQGLCGFTPRPTPMPPTPKPTPKPTPFPTPFPTPISTIAAWTTTTTAVANNNNVQCVTKTSCASCLYLSGACKFCVSTGKCVAAAANTAEQCSSTLVLLSSACPAPTPPSNGGGTLYEWHPPTPPPRPTDDPLLSSETESATNGSNNGGGLPTQTIIIVCAVIGGILVLAAIVTIVVCVVRKKNYDYDDTMHSANPVYSNAVQMNTFGTSNTIQQQPQEDVVRVYPNLHRPLPDVKEGYGSAPHLTDDAITGAYRPSTLIEPAAVYKIVGVRALPQTAHQTESDTNSQYGTLQMKKANVDDTSYVLHNNNHNKAAVAPVESYFPVTLSPPGTTNENEMKPYGERYDTVPVKKKNKF